MTSEPLGPEFLYDLEEWTRRIPLEDRDDYYDYYPICGPILPLLRAEEPLSVEPKVTVPTDVYLFAKGEPARRDVTKVNGLPYYPARRAWPGAAEGYPQTFLAQIRMVDSRDVTGELPGDMLLLFCDYDFQNLDIEWVALGETDLVSACPAPGWTFFTGYGVRWRTFDYPAWPGCPDDFPRVQHGPLSISRVQVPPFDDVDPADVRFTIHLGSLYAIPETPYPGLTSPSRSRPKSGASRRTN
jgi:hypothetical protein